MDEKVFDVRKIKIKTFENKPRPVGVEKPSVIKMHTRFFDWHTIATLLYGLAIILVFVAAVFITRYLVVKKQAETNKTQTVENKIADTTTEIKPEETKQAGENPFVDTGSETTETKTETIDKAAIKIRVLNGNGTTGDGAKAKTELADAGFTVSEVGNAKRQDYTNTQVYYIAGKKEQATLIQDALKTAGRTTNLEEASPDLVGNDYEILVVTGKK